MDFATDDTEEYFVATEAKEKSAGAAKAHGAYRPDLCDGERRLQLSKAHLTRPSKSEDRN